MSDQDADDVLVKGDDLAWALAYMTVDGPHAQGVKDRLTAALLETAGCDSNPPENGPQVLHSDGSTDAT